MADQIPIKVVRTVGDSTGLAEFQVGDTAGIAHGGTGGITDLEARTNLDVPSKLDLSAHIGDTANPHSVTPAQIGAATSADLVTHTGTPNAHGVTPANIGAIPTTDKGIANGVATLDAGSKIPAAQIPAVALPTMSVVADAAARILLTVEEGDEAKQLDDGTHWIYDGTTWYKYQDKYNVYGSYYLESHLVSNYNTTTVFTFEDILSLVPTIPETGLYRISWCYYWQYDSTTTSPLIFVSTDGAQLCFHKDEPKDTTATMNGSGFSEYPFTAGDTPNILIQGIVLQSGKVLSFDDAKLEIIRVS